MFSYFKPSFSHHFLRDQEYDEDLLSLLKEGQNCNLNWYKVIQNKGMGTGHNQISFSYKLNREAYTLLFPHNFSFSTYCLLLVTIYVKVN